MPTEHASKSFSNIQLSTYSKTAWEFEPLAVCIKHSLSSNKSLEIWFSPEAKDPINEMLDFEMSSLFTFVVVLIKRASWFLIVEEFIL